MVEEAKSLTLVLIDADIEGNVLVHRVAGLGIVADGVLGTHTQAAQFFVEVSGLFTEAVEVVLLPVHAGVVGDAAQVILFKGALGQVAVKRFAVCVQELEGEGLL